MKRWLLAGALAFATAGQGLASDLPPPAAAPPPRAPVAYVPPVSPVYNWGGLYFGFNLGYGFGTGNWVDPNDPGGATGNFNLTGFFAGATLGVNFQTDGFVFGAEADFDGSSIDGKKPLLQHWDAMRDEKFLVFNAPRTTGLCCRSRPVLRHGRRCAW
jgi:outer membrane immunogenic protein